MKNIDNVETIDFGRHGKLKVKPNPGCVQAKESNLVGVVLSELGLCASNFPIVFIHNPKTNKFVLVAMLGLRPGENMYFGEEYWESTYIPLAVQRHPFLIGYDDRLPNGEEITACIEINSPFLSETDGIPLFTEAGEETDFLRSRHQMLNAIFEGEKFTSQFAQKLADLELLTPLEISLHQQQGEIRKINGLHTINELKLKSLSSEQLKELQTLDFLPPCYLILASLYQLNQMIRFRNRKGIEQIVNFKLDFGVESKTAEQ